MDRRYEVGMSSSTYVGGRGSQSEFHERVSMFEILQS